MMDTTENDSLGFEYIERYISLRKYQKIGVIHRTGNVVTISAQMSLFPDPNDAEKKPIEEVRKMIDFWFPRVERKGPNREETKGLREFYL